MRVDDQDITKRLDRLEAAQEEIKRAVARVVSLMDGDPSYRIIGIADRLDAVIKTNEDWKQATQLRIGNNENRIKALENNNQIVIAPATAALLIVIGALCLVVAYFVLTWMQSA